MRRNKLPAPCGVIPRRSPRMRPHPAQRENAKQQPWCHAHAHERYAATALPGCQTRGWGSESTVKNPRRGAPPSDALLLERRRAHNHNTAADTCAERPGACFACAAASASTGPACCREDICRAPAKAHAHPPCSCRRRRRRCCMAPTDCFVRPPAGAVLAAEPHPKGAVSSACHGLHPSARQKASPSPFLFGRGNKRQ